MISKKGTGLLCKWNINKCSKILKSTFSDNTIQGRLSY
jgi:hypothetical protein